MCFHGIDAAMKSVHFDFDIRKDRKQCHYYEEKDEYVSSNHVNKCGISFPFCSASTG